MRTRLPKKLPVAALRMLHIADRISTGVDRLHIADRISTDVDRLHIADEISADVNWIAG